jgi:23S rRNA (adenine2503-C2)-methyltransferase
MKTSFYKYTFEDLQELFQQHQFPTASARLLYNWHYKKNRREVFSHQDLSKKVKQFLEAHFEFDLPNVHLVQESTDKTVKFLFELKDRAKVESVLIPFQNKYTLCLSSQVGCAMNCAFCYTGTQGLSRNLNTEEIVGQFLQAKKWLVENRAEESRILNVVFMGQGEPLHNFEAVRDTCRIFLSSFGISLANRKITVSTSGYLPGLRRWKSEMPNVNIALSLHSPFLEKRSQLIPINKVYPLPEILNELKDIPSGDDRFVTYQYLLIKGFNDTPLDAEATGKLLQGRRAYINLIPFNPFPGSHFQRPEPHEILEFKTLLEEFKIPVTLRTTKGDEILAACGQLHVQGQNKSHSG